MRMSELQNVNLPEDIKDSVADAFNEAVDKKANVIQESFNRQYDQLDRELQVMEFKEVMLKESLRDSARDVHKIIQESNREAQKNEIKLQLLESKLIQEAQEAVEDSIEDYVENNRFERLEMEDREKLNKLLNLFEEMLAVLGKEIVDITEGSDEQIEAIESEANDVIQELEDTKEALEAENEELLESINNYAKQNVILEVALENGLSHKDYRKFNSLCESVNYESKSKFRNSIQFLLENSVNSRESDNSMSVHNKLKRKHLHESKSYNDDLVYSDYLRKLK